MFSERYEQPDPISLPSERTHGDRDVVNQSDGKPELGTPIPPFHFLPLSLFLSFFRTPFYSTSDFHATLVCFLPSVHFRPARFVIASVQMTIHRSGQIAIINGIGFAAGFPLTKIPRESRREREDKRDAICTGLRLWMTSVAATLSL